MMFGYEIVYFNEPYYPPSYQHVIEPDKEYKPLVEYKPAKPKVVLSVPLFKKTVKPKTIIYFDFDSYKVKPKEKKKLKGITGVISLKGYASPEGTKQYNLRLSQKRINEVKKHLKNVKIKFEKAYGEEGCNLPKEKWHLCRKVEIEKIR